MPTPTSDGKEKVMLVKRNQIVLCFGTDIKSRIFALHFPGERAPFDQNPNSIKAILFFKEENHELAKNVLDWGKSIIKGKLNTYPWGEKEEKALRQECSNERHPVEETEFLLAVIRRLREMRKKIINEWQEGKAA